MSDSHDSGAVERILDAIALGARTGLECATVHRDDLLAVLGENETMRNGIQRVRTHLAYLGSSFRVIQEGYPGFGANLQANLDAIRTALGLPPHPQSDARLVGEWQPAEGGEKP